ncbi:hypothetical protein F2Q70_00042486 [Brassica cretica]|uniref:Uncharacterized protein n=1 Tax=Brassica cretica TaxID=69181 RepID=A0A3N6SUY5_BRACR|nr:hypothetical protein F2Q70_00042486 [Brassica cretica]
MILVRGDPFSSTRLFLLLGLDTVFGVILFFNGATGLAVSEILSPKGLPCLSSLSEKRRGCTGPAVPSVVAFSTGCLVKGICSSSLCAWDESVLLLSGVSSCILLGDSAADGSLRGQSGLRCERR